MNKTALFLLIVLSASCSSKQIKYQVEMSNSPQIDSIFSANRLDTIVKPEFAFYPLKTYNYEKFLRNDAMDLSYFLNAQSLSSRQYVVGYHKCFIDKDSIIILGGLGDVGGVFFRIRIFQDKFDAEIYLSAAKGIYLAKEDTTKCCKEITLKPVNQILKLAENPIFRLGANIKGMATLEAEPFYQLDTNQIPLKLNTKFNLIFDTEIKKESDD